MNTVEMISGQIKFPALNADLNELDYAIAKAYVWKSMINENQSPKKWLKATKTGTKVKFDHIPNVEHHEAAISDLKAYIDELNSKYNLDFSVV